MKKQNLFYIVVVIQLIVSNSLAKRGCSTGTDLQNETNKSLEQTCKKQVTIDLSRFKSEPSSICSSEFATVDLVEKALSSICSGSADELASKVKSVQIISWDKKESKYEIKDKVVVAYLSKDDGVILSKWNEEAEKFKNFLKKSTGLALLNAREKEDVIEKNKRAEKKVSEEKIKAEKNDQKKAAEEKRKQAQEKFKTAQEKFKAKNSEIWARPGNSPSDIELKKKESDEAQAEFNRAGEIYKKELEEIKAR